MVFRRQHFPGGGGLSVVDWDRSHKQIGAAFNPRPGPISTWTHFKPLFLVDQLQLLNVLDLWTSSRDDDTKQA